MVIAPLFLDSCSSEMELVFLLPFRNLKFVAIDYLISIQSLLYYQGMHYVNCR